MENLEGNITIQIVDQNHKEDVNLANESFSLFGRFLPTYNNGKWNHEISYFEKPSEMCFPAEKYSFDELSKNSVIIGAYVGQKCVGLAILQDAWFKYMYYMT